MQLDWSTFLLEIINFLVLVWILKRFLYQPILAVIERRREGVEKTLGDARALHAEAETMKEQYEHRLTDWEKEKAQAWQSLKQEIDNERARQQEQLQSVLARQREAERVVEERRLQELARSAETAAIALGARFAQRLLARLAIPELEARIIDLTVEDLATLPEPRLAALKAAAERDASPIQVSTAYPLDETRRASLQQALERLLGTAVDYAFRSDPALVAGLRINIGPWVLQANLRDELHFFTEAADAGH